MVEVKLGAKTLELPYVVQVSGVTEEMFEEWVDEDTKAELRDGVMVVHPPATIRHDDIGGFLQALMSFYVDTRAGGKVLGPDALTHLATCRKFAPDVFFIRPERVPTPLPKEFEGAPDLVVEVLSSNRADDLNDKRPAYREAGVEEIWLVDLEHQQLLMDRKRGEGYEEEIVTHGPVGSQVVPGFWIDVGWLWQEPLPNRMQCLQEILNGGSR